MLSVSPAWVSPTSPLSLSTISPTYLFLKSWLMSCQYLTFLRTPTRDAKECISVGGLGYLAGPRLEPGTFNLRESCYFWAHFPYHICVEICFVSPDSLQFPHLACSAKWKVEIEVVCCGVTKVRGMLPALDNLIRSSVTFPERPIDVGFCGRRGSK